jgi:hypothetical protein
MHLLRIYKTYKWWLHCRRFRSESLVHLLETGCLYADGWDSTVWVIHTLNRTPDGDPRGDQNMLYCTKTLITNKCTKRVLSSIVTHFYMFRPCWVVFRENFSVLVTLRLHFILECECAVDGVLRCFWRRVRSVVRAGLPGPQRVHASNNNAVHSQQHIRTQV